MQGTMNHRALALALAWAGVACVNPFNPALDQVTCGADDLCPPGYACDVQSRQCRPESEIGLSEIDAGSPDEDARMTDAGSSVDARQPIDAGRSMTFPYQPSNFTPANVTPSDDVVLDCDAVFDSQSMTFPAWCNVQPTAMMKGDAVVLASGDFTITGAGSLTIIGDRPVILAVFGTAEIDGPIDASARGATPGPGGSVGALCNSGTGSNGGTANGEGGGGGGGGFGTGGGGGGDGGQSGGVGGASGGADGDETLIPLRSGCSGGNGGVGGINLGGDGGGGGGAVQISAAMEMRVSSAISAAGGGGSGGVANDGGGGGGSGGGILLEGVTVSLASAARLTANGGGGGEGGSFGGTTQESSGADGSIDSDVPASGGSGSPQGGNGGDGAAGATDASNGNTGAAQTGNDGGGGGGGGGHGRIRLNAMTSCTAAGGSIVSPAASIGAPGDCPTP